MPGALTVQVIAKVVDTFRVVLRLLADECVLLAKPSIRREDRLSVGSGTVRTDDAK
jgi:hypothetical protein